MRPVKTQKSAAWVRVKGHCKNILPQLFCLTNLQYLRLIVILNIRKWLRIRVDIGKFELLDSAVSLTTWKYV